MKDDDVAELEVRKWGRRYSSKIFILLFGSDTRFCSEFWGLEIIREKEAEYGSYLQKKREKWGKENGKRKEGNCCEMKCVSYQCFKKWRACESVDFDGIAYFAFMKRKFRKYSAKCFMNFLKKKKISFLWREKKEFIKKSSKYSKFNSGFIS